MISQSTRGSQKTTCSLSSHHACPRDEIQVIRLGSKHVYLGSCLASLTYGLKISIHLLDGLCSGIAVKPGWGLDVLTMKKHFQVFDCDINK